MIPSLMINAQRAAIARPCKTAMECVDRRYRWYLPGYWSLVLTVNVGEGAPTWHASVSKHTELSPVFLKGWTTFVHDKAEKILRKALVGVGAEGSSSFEHGGVALHLRRRLTDDEMKELPDD